MRYYFGAKWDAPDTDGDDVTQLPTPVGAACLLCGNLIVEGDVGWLNPVMHLPELGYLDAPMHRGCMISQTVGHLFGFCSCTGYDTYTAGLELVKRADAGTLSVGAADLVANTAAGTYLNAGDTGTQAGSSGDGEDA